MRRLVCAATILALVAAMGSVAGCTSGSAPGPATGTVRVDATADGTTIVLAPGAKLIVALESNPTTGYDWKVPEALPAQLAVADDTFESSAAAGVVGAGGTRTLTYAAAAAGTGVLDIEYVRSWEKGVPPQDTFELTVIVK